MSQLVSKAEVHACCGRRCLIQRAARNGKHQAALHVRCRLFSQVNGGVAGQLLRLRRASSVRHHQAIKHGGSTGSSTRTYVDTRHAC